MRLQRLTWVAALALGGLLACTMTVRAQDAKEGKKGRGPMMQQNLDRMSEELKLTDDQKTKVKALFEEQGKKMRELREDTSLSQEQRREKAQAMREDNNKKMKAILTPEQFTKYEKMREEMRQRAREKKGEGKKKSE